MQAICEATACRWEELREGFKISHANSTHNRYGIGVYFARDPPLAHWFIRKLRSTQNMSMAISVYCTMDTCRQAGQGDVQAPNDFCSHIPIPPTFPFPSFSHSVSLFPPFLSSPLSLPTHTSTYTHTHTHTNTHTHTSHTRTHALTHTDTHTHTHTHTCTHTNTQTYTQTHSHTPFRTHRHTHSRTHTHTHTHRHTDTNTHTHTHTQAHTHIHQQAHPHTPPHTPKPPPPPHQQRIRNRRCGGSGHPQPL